MWRRLVRYSAVRPTWFVYTLAVALPLATLAIRLAAGYHVERNNPAMILFALPILGAAYAGGLGPGLVATVTAAIATNVYLLPPEGEWSLPAGANSGAWLGLIAVGVCISVLSEAMHRSRAKAHSREQLYAVTLASIADGVIATGPDGRIRFINAEAERLTGTTGAEAIGQHADAVVRLAPDRHRSAGATERGILRSRDGAETPVERRTAAIRDPSGEHTGGVLVLHDRGEQEAADALREQMALRGQFEKIAATAPGVLCAVRMAEDGAVSIPFVGPGIEALAGVRPEDVVADASTFFAAIDERDVDAVRSSLAASAASGSPWRQVFRIGTADPNLTWVECHAIPGREPDGATLWHGLLSDVTDRVEADARLREQAELLDLSSDAVFVRAADGERLTLWSSGAQRMYGYSADDALGRASDELLETSWPVDRAAVRDSLERTGRWEGELVHRTADGRELVVLSRQALQRDDSGTPRWILETNTDITQRKQREAALLAADARWHAVAENLPGASLLIFDDELRYIEARGQGLRALAGGASDIIGARAGFGVEHDVAGVLETAYRDALEGRESEFEVAADDRVFYGRTVPLDLGDSKRRGMALFIDITERAAAERRRQRSEERFRTVLESAPDPILGVDGDGSIVFASPRVRTVLGYEPDELVGRPIEMLVPERLRGDHVGHRAAFARSPSTRSMGGGRELFAQRKDGAEIPVEVSLGVVDSAGLTTAILVDITERRQLEDQLRQSQKLEAVGQLAGGVAHDFNNLLMVISGYCAAAQEEIAGGPGSSDLGEVQRAAERASQLTGQLLAFSRRQVLTPVQLNLSVVATELMPMLRRLIAEDVEIVLHAEPDVPPVLGDRGQIEQIIVNLAINARDAMPTGGTLTIETRTIDLDDQYAAQHLDVEPGRYVRLSVTDTGSGIDPETAAHIFEPFFTTKAVGQGTGLGLATVHGIVSQTGGQVRVYSEPGLGASFKVYLPPSDAPVAAEVSVDAAARTGSEGTGRVLVCEDEPLVRRLVERILKRHGYAVIIAATPEDALELAGGAAEPIDMLVSDVIMPGMTGPDLAERVAALQPDIRTLFMSGYTAETITGRGNLPIGSAFLEKPFDGDALLRAVHDLLTQTPPDMLTTE
jgi:two-component system, cell cycle sensor histidine kinase and response regulator CckA